MASSRAAPMLRSMAARSSSSSASEASARSRAAADAALAAARARSESAIAAALSPSAAASFASSCAGRTGCAAQVLSHSEMQPSARQPALAVGAGVLRLQGASHCPCVPTAQHNKQALLQDWHARVVLKRHHEATVRDADETVA